MKRFIKTILLYCLIFLDRNYMIFYLFIRTKFGGEVLDKLYGMKELYDVSIRTNVPLDIGIKRFNVNEAILRFNRVDISQIQQDKVKTQSTGGFHNQMLIDWEIDKQANFALTNGVLSPISWALLSNSKINTPKVKSVGYYETQKTIENEEYCYVELKFCPNCIEEPLGAKYDTDECIRLKPLPPTKKKWIFCYDGDTGKPIKDFTIYNNTIFFKQSYREVMVDYTFYYEDKIMVLEVGNRLLNGFLRLDGKMSVKEEKSGEVSTAILELPKIKLSSNLSLSLGKSYDNSVVSDFYFTAYPEDEKRGTTAKITFLDKELTGDYI